MTPAVVPSMHVIGIDLGRSRHALSHWYNGERVRDWIIQFTAESITECASGLLELGDVTILAEDANDVLVSHCHSLGIKVFTVHPYRLHHFRKYWIQSGHKDDVTDARLLVEAFLLDSKPFYPVRDMPPTVARLRSLTTISHKTAQDRTRHLLRLQQLLGNYYAQALKLDRPCTHRWFWDFLDAAPTPQIAQALTYEDLAALTRGSTRPAREIYEFLHAPSLPVSDALIADHIVRVRYLVQQIRSMSDYRLESQREIKATIRHLPEPVARDYEILCSFPGVGEKTGPLIFSHGYWPIADRNFPAFCSLAGIVPVTKQSGKSTFHQLRTSCNHYLRDACYHSSKLSCQHYPEWKEKYDELQSRGHKSARALRTLSVQQFRRFFGMLRNGSTYDKSLIRS